MKNIKIKELKSYQYHIGLLTEDNKLYMWGINHYDQCGFPCRKIEDTAYEIKKPTEVFVFDEIAITLGIGSNHSGIITESGKIFMWGSNENEQLGDFISNFSTHIPIELIIPDIDNNDKPKSLILGGAYYSGNSALITEKGRLYLWGSNTNGQIGKGTCADIVPTPVDITIFLNGELADILAMGSNHIGLLTKNGKIFMWGYNRFGQIGNGKKEDVLFPLEIKLPNNAKPKSINFGSGYKSSIITVDGALYSWGRGINSFDDEILIPTKIKIPNNEKVKDYVSCDCNHMILTEENNLYIKGANRYGQIGNGKVDKDDVFYDFTKVELPNNEVAKIISMGSGIEGFVHICVVTYNDNIYVWGSDVTGSIENRPNSITPYYIKAILNPKLIKI